MKVTVIVPCFNEETVVQKTYERLRTVAESMREDVELLFVDDGSRDETLCLLKTICQKDLNARIVSFSRNFGHQAAVSAGFKFAQGEVAITIDADLQDPPELIPQMLSLWKTSHGNIVYGKRILRKGESLFKKATAKIFYTFLNKISDIPIPLDTGDFRLVDRKVIDAFNRLPEKNKFIRGLIPWLGFKAVPFPFEREPRAGGETKYSLGKMLNLAVNGFLSFSSKPLQMAIWIGVLNILVSLGLILYVLISFFSHSISAVPGWASTVLIIIFFSGVQLLFLGVIGSYLGRIFDETKRRPEYIVNEVFGGADFKGSEAPDS